MSLKYKFFDYQVFCGPGAKGNSLRLFPISHREDSVAFSRLASTSPTSDTAFYWKSERGIEVRWWSANGPVEFCGHGAVGLHSRLLQEGLSAEIHDGKQVLHPSPAGVWTSQVKLCPLSANDPLLEGLPVQGQAYYRSKTPACIAVELGSREEVRNHPLMTDHLLKLTPEQCGAFILFAYDRELCFRYFSPWWGKFEDQATGSALRYLSSLSSFIENQTYLARQLSEAGGVIGFKKAQGKVEISGQVSLSGQGECAIPNQ